MIFAIDPGTEQSGFVFLENMKVIDSGILPNAEIRELVKKHKYQGHDLAIEMIASYGMPVGKEVFETCVFIGRLVELWENDLRLIYRKDVKMHLCGSTKAKDANIRQALIDLVGPQGTKKDPGPTYGVKSHAWAALGVAVTAEQT